MKKEEIQKHRKIEDFIRVLRGSFHDTVLVYRYGGCYGFYQVMRAVFPDARAYFDGEDKDHILVKIGGRFYDIKGEDLGTDKRILLSTRDHEVCAKWAVGQRIEYMVAKHDRQTAKIAKDA